MSKLTIKQKKFADEYIISGNATKAAIIAGYSKKYANTNASKLLQNTTIKTYIEERLKEIDSEKIADQAEVLQYLSSIMRGEQKEQTLRGLGEGYQQIDDIDVSAKDRIKAAELIGKRYALWTDKQEVSGDLSVIFVDDIGSDPNGG
ncbi:terminase small subunit [Carnobacterium pleistocenium]|uniref:terminase small subunit n=1 Tax=Carnobacterium pleistocenium TaxID=181073 RepID=UPI00054D1102|nr:terminase small subunit [Carnobacterium pleistocenium]